MLGTRLWPVRGGARPARSEAGGTISGEAGLEHYNVKVGDLPGVQASDVPSELAEFDRKLRQARGASGRTQPMSPLRRRPRGVSTMDLDGIATFQTPFQAAGRDPG